jgi:hypothetical protein
VAWFDIPRAMRELLLTNTELVTAVSNRVHYQELPQASAYPHVWFTRTGRNEDDALEGGHLVTERFTVEVVGDSDVEGLLDAIFDTLSNWRASVGDKDIQLVDVEDADDDYIFRSVGESEPTYMHALQVVVYWVSNN